MKKFAIFVVSLILVGSTLAGQTETNAQQKSQEITMEEKSLGFTVLKDLLAILVIDSHDESSQNIDPFENQTIYVGVLDNILDLDFKEYTCQVKTEHNIYRLGVTRKYSEFGLRFIFTRPKGEMGIAKAILVSSDIHLKEGEQLQLTANDSPEPFSLFVYLVNDGEKEFINIRDDQSKQLYRFGRKLYRMNCKKTEKEPSH